MDCTFCGGGNGTDRPTAIPAGELEEPFVEHGCQPGPPLLWRNSSKVDVGHERVAWREHSDEEPAQLPLVVLSDQARPSEVVEEQSGKALLDRTAPPGINDRRQLVIVRGSRCPDVHSAHGSDGSPGCGTVRSGTSPASVDVRPVVHTLNPYKPLLVVDAVDDAVTTAPCGVSADQLQL